ncbi:hypothetical protein J3E69DRAFT_337617 [Trichoderma sp. SZMC 28015]
METFAQASCALLRNWCVFICLCAWAAFIISFKTHRGQWVELPYLGCFRSILVEDRIKAPRFSMLQLDKRHCLALLMMTMTFMSCWQMNGLYYSVHLLLMFNPRGVYPFIL